MNRLFHLPLIFTTASFALLLVFISCKKPAEDNTPLTSDWLIPLVKGHLSINDLSRLEGQSTHFEITPSDFGIASNTPVSSSGMEVAQLGPITIPTQDIIKYIVVDTLIIGMRIENLFPTTIPAGFQIVLRTSSDTSTSTNIAYSQVFSNDLLPNMQDSIHIQVHNSTFTDSLYFFVEKIKIDSFNQVVFDKNIPIDITIEKVRLNEMAFYANQSFNLHDTVAFQPGDLSSITQQWTLNDTAVSGHLNFFTDNNLPLHCSMQLDFLNNQTPLDSVFDNGFIMTGANVNASGLPQNTVSQVNSIGIRKSKIKNIEQCNQLTYRFSLNTNGYNVPYVVFRKNNQLGLQIVSDFKLIINPFSL